MISREEVLMGRDREYPLSEELEVNLTSLLIALNKCRMLYGKPLTVSSGYRPGKYNVAAKGAANSAHLTCEACDFVDNDGQLKQYILNNLSILDSCELYMESPDRTPTWCHLQIRRILSGNRVFKP